MAGNLSPERYDRATLFLHWLTAFIVAEQWIGAHLIDEFAKGFPRIAARSVHISFGLLLGVVLIARIFWRVSRGRHLPAADEGVLQVIAKATHYLLYLLLVAIVPAGVFLVWAQGDSYFDLFTVPAFAGATRALRHNVGEIHGWLANAILIVAGIHALAALFHHFVMRDNVLRRMMPRRS